MKVEQINKKEVSFEPIELSITIEDLDELKALWCRFNINLEDIKDLQSTNEYESNFGDVSTWGIWNILDKNLQEYMEKDTNEK